MSNLNRIKNNINGADIDINAGLNVSGDTTLGNLTVTGDTSLQAVTATTIALNSISATTLYYQGQEIDVRYVNITGDTMTGDLFVNANLTVTGNTFLQATSATTLTATTVNITNFTGTSETIVTTSGSSSLQQYLTTDTRWIADSTLITNIISPANWNNGLYSGSTVGAVEGQMYIGPYYKYVYQDSLVTRYLFADYPYALYTDYTITSGATLVATTATTAVRNVIVNSVTGSTITLPVANQMVFEQIYIKNIGTGTTIINSISPSLIEGSATGSTLAQYENLNLKIYNNQYYKF
jgi:hypothetical protein